MAKTNAQILEHMLSYIEQIDEANMGFSGGLNDLKSNSIYRNAVSMCILQIGELANHLSEDYRLQTSEEVPWRSVRGLRNVVAHQYGKIDEDTLWETIQNDIPMLKRFCIEQIALFRAMNEEACDLSDQDWDEDEQLGQGMTML